MARESVPITDELVERLRRGGASKDLIEFTDRHVARFSQTDIDRAWGRAFGIGVAVGVLIAAVVATWPR